METTQRYSRKDVPRPLEIEWEVGGGLNSNRRSFKGSLGDYTYLIF